MANTVLGVGTGVFLIIFLWILALIFGIILLRASGPIRYLNQNTLQCITYVCCFSFLLNLNFCNLQKAFTLYLFFFTLLMFSFIYYFILL